MQRIVFFICFILLTAVLFGTGGREPESVEITGVVRLVGNDPFTRYALRGDNGKDYFLEFNTDTDAARFLGKRVTVTGTVEIRELKSADGKYTVKEAMLKVLAIRE